jgi:general secretion pathway protein A
VYEAHYGFTEKPFSLTPDPKYLYPSVRHTEAVAHLEYARRERGGFVVITGEVGTGKTMLTRYFLSRLDSTTATALVLYPALTAAELLRSILDDLHVPVAGASLKDHVDALHRFLLQARAESRQVVLLIDEAQDLSPEVLEQVRLISNLETDTEKLIQIVLVGQSELQEMLARRDLRQLAQRVTARYHLAPLNRRETDDYIRHRLSVAGGDGKVVFAPKALAAVHRLSGGVPRLVNLICDRALLAGYVAGTRTIEAPMVREAAGEVGGAPRPRLQVRPALLGAVGGLLALGVAAPFALRGGPASAARPDAAAPVAGAAAAIVPATLTAAPAASTATPGLTPLLLSLEHGASFGAALARVQALWGGGELQRTDLRTHMDQVRRLDLPVVLEMFHPARRDTCFLALLRIEGDDALVSAGAGGPVRVPLRELDRLWTRQALFLWRDFDALAQAPDAARTTAWARESLTRLGYLDGDLDLPAAIARFQRDSELAPDGVIGSRTIMTLYSRGSYARPRLRDARSGVS